MDEDRIGTILELLRSIRKDLASLKRERFVDEKKIQRDFAKAKRKA